MDTDPSLDPPPSFEDSQSQTVGSGAPNSSVMSSPDKNQIAEALERRLRQQRIAAQPEHPGGYKAFDEHYDKRQEFRRLVDPGILRPNPRKLAMESIETLLKLAQNILDKPDEPKFQRFKPTNSTIQRVIMNPKGTVEYARALGFDPEVENFTPYYTFNKKRMTDLRIGAEILKETLDRELPKDQKAEEAIKNEKAAHAAHVANIKQAFLDDRKSREIRERREKEVREARLAAAAARRSSVPPTSPPQSPTSQSQPPPGYMPGSGRTLFGNTVTDADD